MKTKLLFLVLITVIWSCKEKSAQTKTEQPPQKIEQEPPKVLSKSMKEIIQFADISITDPTDVKTHLKFKVLDSSGVREEKMEELVSIYKKAKKTKTMDALPLFEIKNTTNCVLIVSEKGYGGNIWGKVLMDKSTMEIVKVEFDHRAESEGYGDGISLSSFENLFSKAKIEWQGNNFGQSQGGKMLVEGRTIIDGISGATVTTTAVIQMMNEGIEKYRPYLETTNKS
ncbi:FMN-binding protein [Flagellimonas nanhaiensis]|uniref:FMN-binding protein n=1 Tax=Flagellimonas nanhaiensis TaxID=2292706 RepID=A0A371JMT2_9FLAO|nr:FMN-binding protein [Allomuricauda nanhaiensis]RDY58449.1 FMN-binding protein [Allomuricauda nanhaiensis]